MPIARLAIAVGLFAGLLPSISFAGEWYAERLRGVVLMMVEDQWVPIERGTTIPDSRIIRTGANGQVTFRSGEQVIELTRDTQIQISSAEARDYTWVLQAGGEITVDVDAREVEHFGVRTFHLVTVVKGTRFTVTADEQTASVSVERGVVAVEDLDTGRTADVQAGQRATGGDGDLVVGAAAQVSNTPAAPAASASTTSSSSSSGSSTSSGGAASTPASTGGSAPGGSSSSGGGSSGVAQAAAETVSGVAETASGAVETTVDAVEDTVETVGSVVEDVADSVTGVVEDVTESPVVESITGKLF
ncbi:FecR family protein [Pelagibacterium xiamenense]|uniref:FecR family protein n=1 Tax=Pelagibacterium xiamenense TaxID=2901140 RepID=UPI001E4B10D7|nr:FecR family protein [Pelagibacterium xiamenense]MCD7059777.1 FecR family protein [Pelagibacterium xiamenense]